RPGRTARQPVSGARPAAPTPSSACHPVPKEPARAASPTPSPTVAAYLQQKVVHILPTACVLLDTGSTTFEMGAMIDPCMPVSSIDWSLAAAYRLPITQEGEDEVCTATLRTRTGDFKLEVVLGLDPSLKIRTPL
ncbi:hypothetical protein KR032_008173, partial [Drosophila birchii]